jgi:hypothetical protein
VGIGALREFVALPPLKWEVGMANGQRNSVSAFDCDILREAFRKLVVEEHIQEDQWRDYAARLIRTWTGSDVIDPDMLEWIVRK